MSQTYLVGNLFPCQDVACDLTCFLSLAGMRRACYVALRLVLLVFKPLLNQSCHARLRAGISFFIERNLERLNSFGVRRLVLLVFKPLLDKQNLDLNVKDEVYASSSLFLSCPTCSGITFSYNNPFRLPTVYCLLLCQPVYFAVSRISLAFWTRSAVGVCVSLRA